MDVDYSLAFNLAPVGLCLSRNRSIVDCNQQLCEMFGSSRELLVGQSFQVLYPSADEYERLGARMAPILNAKGHYSDDRIMKRVSGEIFWCHVTGRALEPRRAARIGHLGVRGPEFAAPRQGRAHGARTRGGRPPAGRHDFQGNRQDAGDQPSHRRDLSRAADAQVQGQHHRRPGAQAHGRRVAGPSGSSAAQRSARGGGSRVCWAAPAERARLDAKPKEPA